MNNDITSGPTKNSKVGFKVAGILLGIIAIIVLAALIFIKTVLPGIMYNNAIKQAEQGNYYEAYKILIKCENYKDSLEKRGEYILNVGENCLNVGKIDEALKFFDAAYSSQNSEASKKAAEYYFNIGMMFLEQDNLDFEKAKQCFEKATNSSDIAIKTAAEAQLQTLQLNQ